MPGMQPEKCLVSLKFNVTSLIYNEFNLIFKNIKHNQNNFENKSKSEKMEKKMFHKNIFDSAFDSFEFDDGFLNKMDAEVKKNRKPEIINTNAVQEKVKPCNDNIEECDFSLSFENFSDSDFSDFNSKLKKKSSDSKKVPEPTPVKDKNESNMNNIAFIGCLSPIQGAVASNLQNGSFSSTPIVKKSSPVILRNELKNVKKTSQTTKADYVYFEADLFDDWNDNFTVQNLEDKDMITMSQAVQLIEKAEEFSKEPETSSNQSVNLLTGEVIKADFGNVDDFFVESFNVESTRKSVVKEPVCESSRLNVQNKSKPPAAQKLVFESDKNELPCKTNDDNEMHHDYLQNVCFSSDDEFFVLTPVSGNTKETKRNNSKSSVGVHNLADDSDCSVNFVKKRTKCLRVIESDDSLSPKSDIQDIKRTRRKNRNNQGREFLDSEAEVSDEIEVSSDEDEELKDEYEKSFLDEESYCTQNHSADMTAKYLQSLKSVGNAPGTFKIPKPKPFDVANIFSQIPEEQNTDYEFDSFCVSDIEEDTKNELSELEIAEQILEIDRKRRKRQRSKEY